MARYKKFLVFVPLLLLSSFLVFSLGEKNGGNSISDSDYPWTYKCVEETMDGPACQRQMISDSLDEPVIKIPLKICILTCGKYGGMWPYPTGAVSLGKTLSNFSTQNLIVSSLIIAEDKAKVRNMTLKAVDILRENIRLKIPEGYTATDAPGKVELNIVIDSVESKIRLETDESYSLKITNDEDTDTVSVTINAPTFFGVRHGLETLSQLLDFNIETSVFQIVNTVEITDAPKFRYRGLLIDTARNFIPIKDLKRLVDGLSYNKMSVLHWHLTDSNSYPFYSKRVPQMAKYGTFSSKKIYTPEDVTEFLEYANQRGIKVIPELDAPAHAGNGWQFGELEGLGELSLCLNAEPYWDYCIQPPCGQLNPLNNNTYIVLGDLYKDLLDVFDNDYFHMGGDEISFDCWLASKEIQEWMSVHNSTDLMDIWGLFQETALKKLKEATDKSVAAIVWTSEMTARARKYLSPDDYVIQIWSKSTDDIVAPIYNESYRVIFSNNDTVYLDHGYGPWRGTQHNVGRKSWHVLYGQDLLGQIERVSGKEVAEKMYREGKLLGGEACMWAEKVDALNMDGKIWPRTAAYAERLWSNPPSNANATRFAYPRLIHQRDAMAKRGLFPDALLPEACYHIWGFCDRYD